MTRAATLIRRTGRAIALALSLASGAASAAPNLAKGALPAAPRARADGPAFYSHTMSVSFATTGVLVQLQVPKDVYLHARSAQLDDLRLYDRQGRPVAFAVRPPASGKSGKRLATPVKLFALAGGSDPAAPLLSIRTRPDGSLQSVETGPGKPGQDLIGGVLVDLGPPRPGSGAVSALVFAAPADQANYSAQLGIEASDDLQEWTQIAYGQVDWLSNANSDTVSNNRIAFEPTASRYLRVRWRGGNPSMFAGADAEREDMQAPAAPPESILVDARPGLFPGDLAYPIGPAVPLEAVGFKIAEPGLVMPSVVGRYEEVAQVATVPGAAKQRRWHFVPVLRTTFYSILQNGKVRVPQDLSLAGMSLEQIVIRPTTPIDVRPQLRIGWTPGTLIFSTRQPGPYVLAVGRQEVAGAQAPLADVAPGYGNADLLALEAASVGPASLQRVADDGPSAAQRAGMSAGQRSAILWGFLVLGVGVVALLCWKMAGQLRSENARAAGSDRGAAGQDASPD
ncbi:DUF3999 family protein [Massilia sp. S19_KUP03_FR1]|uniref:DUF3999 family protein n=1 Tax=Massilia sp. S19_KUP03_FR1 TaxID=3025503 RepID=UPI002FCDC414